MRFFLGSSIDLQLVDDQFYITVSGKQDSQQSPMISFAELMAIELQQGIVFDDFVINTERFQTRIQGLSHRKAVRLLDAIRHKSEDWLIKQFGHHDLTAFNFQQFIDQLINAQKYLSQQFIASHVATLPAVGALFSHPFFDKSLLQTPELNAIDLDSSSYQQLIDLQNPQSLLVAQRNQNFVKQEIDRVRSWLANLEAYPLTDEQLTAVVTDEDRNLLIASAGSGKSSTIVAKVVYLLKNNLAQPEEIALLAYNDEASQSLRQRLDCVLSTVLEEPVANRLKISTFHAFGLDVIFQNQGVKPRIVDFAQGGNGALIDFFDRNIWQLCQQDCQFQQDWLTYLALYKRPRPPLFSIDSLHKYYDYLMQIGGKYQQSKVGRKTKRRPVFECLNGIKVTSLEAQMIANWLILHQISFQYLKPVQVSSEHQALPADFYYPEIDSYHDHFAIDEQGRRPVFLEGYDDYLARKQNIVSTYQINHFVTTSADFNTGEVFNKLSAFLQEQGLQPQKLPIDTLQNLVLPHYDKFSDLSIFSSFLQHFKANGASLGDLELKVSQYIEHHGSVEDLETEEGQNIDTLRTQAFLNVFKPLYLGYQAYLNNQNAIDFNDQINQACLLMENRDWLHPFKYLLVDEFQDISQDRKRLIKALLDQKVDCKLFAVGDDWQSIYRFSGADIDIMTHFERHFGVTATNFLTKSFRCYQGIADVASAFVQTNPEQLKKTVTAHADIKADQVQIEGYSSQSEHNLKLMEILDKLNALAYKHQRVLSVFLLARYHRLKPNNLAYLQQRCLGLQISFKSIHASKGLEADYVILLNLASGTYGFPSTLSDDSLLNLVIPKIEHFEHAEERRLFYVALTRAKRGVFILSSSVDTSSFVTELIDMKRVKVCESLQKVDVCPKCEQGKMLERYGQYGVFWGCNLYPACDHTEKCFCPECETGTLVARESEHGKFYGCTNYPECDYIHERGKKKLRYYSGSSHTAPVASAFKRVK